MIQRTTPYELDIVMRSVSKDFGSFRYLMYKCIALEYPEDTLTQLSEKFDRLDKRLDRELHSRIYKPDFLKTVDSNES